MLNRLKIYVIVLFAFAAQVEKTKTVLLRVCYHPFRVITAKMGFSAGYSCHFHIIPVTQQLLEEVIANPRYSKDPDGNDVLLFTSREYCERDLSLEEHSLQIKAVEYLRGELTRCST